MSKVHSKNQTISEQESQADTSDQYIERMEKGIAEGEFKLYLQAKVELTKMKITGAEALVRWDIPGKGLVFPDSFIPIFEKNNTIVDLDYYMLNETCKYLRTRLEQGQEMFPISVNFSRVTMCQPLFCEKVLEIVDRYELPHSYIELEVTESSFNELKEQVLQVIRRLMETGFQVSMDDFGAGYSNLNMLSRLPIHIIKLDRAFLQELPDNKNIRGIIVSVVDLAHAMGLKVVCEGVEQEEHVRTLRKLGCDYAQGFFFSKAVTVNEFEKLYQSFHTPDILALYHEIQTMFTPVERDLHAKGERVLEKTLLAKYPGFLSLRNEVHQIVYLNDNFRQWIGQFTDVDPLGKTNVELAALVPQNVADTFLQCHDGSMELQKDEKNQKGLKKVIEFHGNSETQEDTQYLDVLKYWVDINGKPYIFTIAYDVTGLYVENMRNLQSSMTDSLTGARNRRYMYSEMGRYQGHYAAFLNINRFKEINEQEGYLKGDAILKEFVSFIRAHIEGMISMIRLGGDEFIVIFEKDLEKKEICEQFEKARKEDGAISFRAGVDRIGAELDETLKRLEQKMKKNN